MYPDYIMEILRQRKGLDEIDDSKDELISKTHPLEVFEEVLGWELGDSSWASTIIGWLKDCGFKVELNEEREAEERDVPQHC